MKFDCLVIDEREIATYICKDGEREIATKEIKKKLRAHTRILREKKIDPGICRESENESESKRKGKSESESKREQERRQV